MAKILFRESFLLASVLITIFVIKDKGMTYLRNKKFDKAKTLFEKGCKGDAPASCGMLGVMYRDAKGVKRSVSEARRYMGKSCRLGMKSACTGLRRLR